MLNQQTIEDLVALRTKIINRSASKLDEERYDDLCSESLPDLFTIASWALASGYKSE